MTRRRLEVKESEKEGLEEAEVVGLAERISQRGGKPDKLKTNLTAFATKCHLSSAFSLSQV